MVQLFRQFNRSGLLFFNCENGVLNEKKINCIVTKQRLGTFVR